VPPGSVNGEGPVLDGEDDAREPTTAATTTTVSNKTAPIAVKIFNWRFSQTQMTWFLSWSAASSCSASPGISFASSILDGFHRRSNAFLRHKILRCHVVEQPYQCNLA
jgi:hypothetical protein